jgi:PAS domain S-box-containing protein
MAKILVVEDENIVAWDIKETLEKLGHTVVDLVDSGAEAIGAAVTASPDLVLMDIRLAGAMDGITAGDEIYHQFKIPVVYLTAHADEFTLERAIKTNPFGYIIKPFQAQSLQSTIRIALQRHQLEVSAYMTQVCLENTLNINSMGNGVISTDRQGLVTFMNPMAENITGWQASDAIGIEIDRVFRLIWETDGIRIENPSSRAMRLNEPIKSPDRCWLLHKAGKEIPIADVATPIVKPDGEIVGSIVVFQDNTDRLTTQMDLWERNQDLEFFQLKIISQLQAKTAEHQQAIACIQVLDLILKQVHIAQTETELLQIALQQLGSVIDADYCWCTLHDPQADTATIVGEYFDRECQINPTSKIGSQIDILLYPGFYNHLFESESWIDPPAEIIPKPYLNLLTPTAQILICPIATAPQELAELAEHSDEWVMGEVGIVTTGKPPWTAFQARPIGQVLSYAVKLFRQTHQTSIDRESIVRSLKWLNMLKDEFRSSIADVQRAMHISATILKNRIRSIDVETENLALVEQHQTLHRELAKNLRILQAEWQRQFQLIDTLIDVQTNGMAAQIQSLSDIQFGRWIAEIVKSCTVLTQRYQQEIGYRITEQQSLKLLYPFPILELIVIELFENACKYTPRDRLIILEVDIRDRQLQFSIISVGITLSARELELMFLPFARDGQEFAQISGITGIGLAVVNKLVPLLGGKIRATTDRNETISILEVPLSNRS